MNNELSRAVSSRIRLVILDVDGVLTDGGLYIGATDEGRRVEMKRFEITDGLGIKVLVGAGIDVVLVSGRVSPANRLRAEELGIPCYEGGGGHKLPILNSLLKERSAMVERARASASDLAHGLKTPLAILSAEGRTLAESGDASSAREIDLQVGVMNRHIERQLARARARGQSRLMSPGTELAPAFEKLVRAFRQLPRGDEIDWRSIIKYGLSADIDPMDLEEIAGILSDDERNELVRLLKKLGYFAQALNIRQK